MFAVVFSMTKTTHLRCPYVQPPFRLNGFNKGAEAEPLRPSPHCQFDGARGHPGGPGVRCLHCYLPVQLPLSLNPTILNVLQISGSTVFMTPLLSLPCDPPPSCPLLFPSGQRSSVATSVRKTYLYHGEFGTEEGLKV